MTSGAPSAAPATPPPVRIGVIGCGNVMGAYRMTLDRLRTRGWATVSVACGRPAQRDEAIAALRPERFTTEASEVLQAPDVDLVVILTPMPTHAALVRGALEAGRHVLVEKPLATSLAEAQDLASLAAKSPGHLVCAPFTWLSPTFRTLAAHLQRGDIGRPTLARARYGWSGPWWNEWFYRPGGGCLLDLGVYCVTSLVGLLGPVRRVSAMTGVAQTTRAVGGREIRVEAEDTAQVLLDFGDACFGVVTTGFTLQKYRSPALEVYGTGGTIQLLGDDWDPEGYELWQNAAGCWQCFGESEPDWPWTDGLRHLVESVRDGTAPAPGPEVAVHVLEVLLQAQEASRTGRTLDLQTRFTRPDWTTSALVNAEAAHRQHDRTREH
ncbi:MAG: Gfo/Idh/MocA family oxidoreductase [Verrucomicrobia bacterium]|nr:Gfo/Idh/MocA family oxidoreductase [Verrucomicrobiota bacterium]